jgi:DNA-binding response OmpR family regulator
MMPDQDGYEVCASIRKKSNVPIIMLTALNRENDVIHGLDTGANDFLSKPVSRSLLLSRSQAALRSSQSHAILDTNLLDYSDGCLTMMLARRRVWTAGRPVPLTPKEFDLLAYLFRHTGRMIASHEILTHAWDWDDLDSPHDVYTSFESLRRKIELDAKEPHYLVNKDREEYSFLKRGLARSSGVTQTSP